MANFRPLVIDQGTVRQSTDADTLLPVAPKVISASIVLFISTTGNDTTGDGTSGNPWATAAKALAYLADHWIMPGYTVTIKFADGTYSLTSPIEVAHPQSNLITISGTNTYAKSLTSIVSTSGASGAYTFRLALTDVANVAVNDYVYIFAASGGTNPRGVLGCHKVMAVGADYIDVLSSLRGSSVPSGAVTATVTVLKTILSFTGSWTGILVRNGVALSFITKLAVVGDQTSASAGFRAQMRASLSSSVVGISGWATGVLAEYSAMLNVSRMAVSNCTGSGFVADKASAIRVSNCVASGNGSSGFVAQSGSVVDGDVSTGIGNVLHGFVATSGSSCLCPSCVAQFNQYAGGVASLGSVLTLSSGTITDNVTYGVYALNESYAYVYNATVSGNGTNYSPALNTQGNNWSEITT